MHGLIFQVYQHGSSWSTDDQNNKFYRRRAGGHRIASFLRSLGWDIEVIDFSAEFSFEELKEICQSRITNKTVFCGFSCIFQSWPTNIEQIANWIKHKHTHVYNIWGGGTWPNVNSASIDYYISGYGENALYNLLKYLTGNSSKKLLHFDLRYANKKVITANKVDPSFPMNILTQDYEDRDFMRPEEWGHIELSRGCIFKCKFCYYPVLGVKGDYTQDTADFKRSMQRNYDRYGIKNYYVVDETFNDSSEKIKKFADAVESLSFVPFYSGFIRADLLISRPSDREDLMRMNFLGHYYGIESFNFESAKAIGKGMPTEKLQHGLLEIKNYFLNNNRKIYRGTISMIAGLPYETVATMKKSLAWLRQKWSDQHSVWFPLTIPDKTYQTHWWADSISDMGINFENYGYRIKTTDHGSVDWENDDLSFTYVN